jgi:hypothetical protein
MQRATADLIAVRPRYVDWFVWWFVYFGTPDANFPAEQGQTQLAEK